MPHDAATARDAVTERDDPRWSWEFRIEDFVIDRLDEEAAAAQAAGDQAAAHRAATLRLIASTHTIYIDADRRNWGRCAICSPSHGIPCMTIRYLAGLWIDHPDHPNPKLSHAISFDEAVRDAGSHRRLRAPDA